MNNHNMDPESSNSKINSSEPEEFGTPIQKESHSHEPEDFQRTNKNSVAAELFDYIEIFVFSMCVVMLIFTFVIRLCGVDGDSMNRTLFNKETLIVSDMNYTPHQGDIIVFHQTSATSPTSYESNMPLVKRVIATPGFYVKIDYESGTVYVSDDDVFDTDDILDESDYIYLDSGKWNGSGMLETYVPDGYLFVMGDNRNNSRDSRGNIGLVDQRRVFGKVILRIFPLSTAGSVYE